MLKKRLAIAVTSIVNESISSGLRILFVASNTKIIVMINKKRILNKVPNISALYHPKVRRPFAPLELILSDIIDSMNPIRSEARCAVSAKIAIEFAR